MFGFFIIRKLFDFSCISDHVQPISKPLSVVISWVWSFCGHLVCAGIFMWSLDLCRNVPAQSCVIMWSHWSQQNEAQKQTRNFYIKFTLLTVQFNVPQKCYEFKPNPELLKTCVNAMNTLEYVISHEIVVWILFGFFVPKFLANTGK